MTPPSTEVRVRGVIARTFRLSAEQAAGPLQMGDPPAWDSLGHMGLVADIEKEFGVRFPGYALPELVSVEAIVRAVDERTAAG